MADQHEEELKTALLNNDTVGAAEKAQEYLDWIKNVPLTIAITGETGSGIIMTDQHEEVKTALLNNDTVGAAKKAQEYLDWINNVPLTIAITGESGSGKSTLVNALRGINNAAEGSAPTGPEETTMEPTEYKHPQNPNITIWDLPGIGTTRFKADKYLHHVGFKKYDVFIIVSNIRFKENDAKLAQEIKKMKKKFYFVRSKVDQTIQGEIESDPDLKEEDLLKTIRDDCIRELEKLHIKSPKVFLMSGLRLHLYDFNELWKALDEELPQQQRDALLLALPVTSEEVIEQKKKALGNQIKWLTAAVASVPVPGLSEGVDLSMIVAFVIKCRSALGLNAAPLKQLSTFSKVPVEELEAEVKSLLGSEEVTRDLVTKVLSTSGTFITARAIQEGARFIPVVGTLVAVSLSGCTTYRALNFVLDTLTEDALRVFRRAVRGNTSE